MARYILSILWLLACLNSFSQQKCDSTSFSQTNKILLQNFWTEFKDAINNKDKTKLANLCHFPLRCDYCIFDSANSNDKPNVKVTKISFDSSQYKIFFTERLIREVNNHSLPRDIFIFQPYYDRVYRKCSYTFGYIAREENAQHPGMQIFFDLAKINGQFKIISSWTLP
jgi:hypothetical protein